MTIKPQEGGGGRKFDDLYLFLKCNHHHNWFIEGLIYHLCNNWIIWFYNSPLLKDLLVIVLVSFCLKHWPLWLEANKREREKREVTFISVSFDVRTAIHCEESFAAVLASTRLPQASTETGRNQTKEGEFNF